MNFMTPVYYELSGESGQWHNSSLIASTDIYLTAVLDLLCVFFIHYLEIGPRDIQIKNKKENISSGFIVGFCKSKEETRDLCL